MVNAKFEFEPEIGVLTMTVTGHAAFAELGKDPVCAGASVLAMTVAQCIQSMSETGQLQKKANIIIRNGRVTVTAKPKPESFSQALHTFYVGETGMELLAAAYPGHVAVKPFVTPDEGADNKDSST
jgi:uncharacterized protein YsxB (DUF464 family)